MGKGTKEEHSVYLVHDSIPQRGERKHGRRYQKRAVYGYAECHHILNIWLSSDEKCYADDRE